MHKLFDILHPNRWFVWAVIIMLTVGAFVYVAVQEYSLEQEYNATADGLFYSLSIQKK